MVDLFAAYYYRALQANVAVHVCQIGYCRKSSTAPCKYGLPATEIILHDRPSTESVRTDHRRVYMKDDAWLKSVCLRTLVWSGMNVQTNVHHPDGAHKGLLYSVKYQLKDEPKTFLKGVDAEDHSAEKYYKTQFLSASQAVAFIYNDPVFTCDKTAIAIYPGWTPPHDKIPKGMRSTIQGEWRRYLKRLTHLGELRHVDGETRNINLRALHLSFLFAPVLKFLRYFREDYQTTEELSLIHISEPTRPY